MTSRSDVVAKPFPDSDVADAPPTPLDNEPLSFLSGLRDHLADRGWSPTLRIGILDAEGTILDPLGPFTDRFVLTLGVAYDRQWSWVYRIDGHSCVPDAQAYLVRDGRLGVIDASLRPTLEKLWMVYQEAASRRGEDDPWRNVRALLGLVPLDVFPL